MSRDMPRKADGSIDFSQMPSAEELSQQRATARQLRYLQAVAREAGMDAAALDERALQEFGVQAESLSRRDASTMIDLIQSRITPME